MRRRHRSASGAWREKQTRRRRARAGVAFMVATSAGALAIASPALAGHSSTVVITLTGKGCTPRPASVPAGQVDLNVTNKRAGVSAAELRTSDLAQVLGAEQKLPAGASGGFSLSLEPGHYVVSCPGASKPRWALTVTGKASGDAASRAGAVNGYGVYVKRNADQLVSSTQSLCVAIGSGELAAAQRAYPRARIHYERIEPVAGIWGALDTEIDARWEDPVTVLSKFVGFHRIEQLLWQDKTLQGAGALCSALVANEKQLARLIGTVTYNRLELAAGATDLVNEAATSKITGEEERYSHTDLTVVEANLAGANEVVSLFDPYLSRHDPALLKTLARRSASATSAVSAFRSSPSYDDTGYVNYATVSNSGRRTLAQALNAYAESLSQLTGKVG